MVRSRCHYRTDIHTPEILRFTSVVVVLTSFSYILAFCTSKLLNAGSLAMVKSCITRL
jgi:hypothetical protein